MCATPIGNLADAPPRLGEALRSADLVYAEDTRRTATLLRHLGVRVPVRSYFAGNEAHRSHELAARLRDGRTIALVTDAGTPAISDPGVSAVAAAREAEADVTVIPGPSAVTAALAVSGLGADRFVFEGFLPRKGKERKQRLANLAGEERTIVVFAAPQRLAVDLVDLADALGDRPLVVCRELTKLHEEIEYTTLAEAAAGSPPSSVRGEFTLVIAGVPATPGNMDDALRQVTEEMAAGTPLSAAVRNAAAAHGVRRRTLYDLALRSQADG